MYQEDIDQDRADAAYARVEAARRIFNNTLDSFRDSCIKEGFMFSGREIGGIMERLDEVLYEEVSYSIEEIDEMANEAVKIVPDEIVYYQAAEAMAEPLRIKPVKCEFLFHSLVKSLKDAQEFTEYCKSITLRPVLTNPATEMTMGSIDRVFDKMFSTRHGN